MDRRRQIRLRVRGPEREGHARKVLERWRASGLSQVAFCRREGISPMTLYRWRREFVPEPSQPAGVPFLRVDVGDLGARGSIEVDLPGGERLRVPPGFDGEDLLRLLLTLERQRC